MLAQILKEIRSQKSTEQAKILAHFFKTKPGEYGAGDKFWGIKVPVLREIAKRFMFLSLVDLQKLLKSEFHEERLTGLFILVYKFKKANEAEKETIYKFYLKNWRAVNNWDLVDTTTPQIVGAYLLNKDKRLLYDFAESSNLWKKRMAIIATAAFIRNNKFDDTLKISEVLLNDKHDLIHKAVGWMLREVGKKSPKTEEQFLHKHYKKMPRTMLRYAIEKFPENLRKRYLNGLI